MTARQALVGAVVVALVSIGGGAALAGVGFSDVPPGSPFEDEIEAIADAGITTGYADGTYRPGAAVSRGAMAAFMGRGFGRVGYDLVGHEAITSGGGSSFATVEVDAGAASAGQGYVALEASITVVTSDTVECPCEANASILRGSDGANSPKAVAVLSDDDVVGTSTSATSLSVSWVVPIPADTTETYELIVQLGTSGSAVEGDVIGGLTATYVPFPASAASAPEEPM